MRPRARRPARTAPVLLVAAVIATIGAGCDGSAPEPRTTTSSEASQQVQKTGSVERRTDRFPALESPMEATWYPGTLGRDEAPGPSTYWIDAVVQLPDAQVEELVQRYGPEGTEDRPDVVLDLRSDLPDVQLLASDELDRAFSTTGFVSRVWLDRKGGRLVLTAVGQ